MQTITPYIVSTAIEPEVRRAQNRRIALGRHLNSSAGNKGQLSLEETPSRLSHCGCEFPTVDVDLFIKEDLKHNPCHKGADVFNFRSGRKHIFAAVVIDDVAIDERYDEVVPINWHVELYKTKRDAAKRVQAILDRISKKCAGLELRNVEEAE